MALSKFGRNYKLNVQTQSGDTLTIELPFTLEFDITRNTLTSANVAQIRVFNLSAKNRAQIRKNVNYNNPENPRLVQLLAGYGDNLSLLFEGNITLAWSFREGTNFVSQIECFDGGFAFINSMSSQTFPAGVEQASVIDSLVQDLAGSGVKVGAIGSFPGTLPRGNAYVGNTCTLLQQLTGGRFYIDNGKANILADNECIAGPVTIISPQSGLLDTPVREETYIYFNMLFEPRLLVGQQVTLQSVTADSNINGNYKIVSLKHRGMISDAVCGDAITNVGLLQPLGSQQLTTVQPS